MTDPPSRVPIPSLLESLNRDHLDPGYAEAARRKARRRHAPDPRSKRNAMLTAVGALLLVGILFGISAVNTEVNAPRTEKARSGLLEDIDRAQQRQSVLASSAAELAERLRSTQAGLGAAGPLQTVSVLENAGQVTPVTGPGLRIVIDEAPADDSGGGGVILDRDVQLLVNDLWTAGAEAISIGGVRLQPRSAIRQAGGSILVDNKPVFWPITIEAIGDPADLQVNAVGLPGFGRFSSFAQLYHIEFDVSAQQDLSLPGGSAGALLYAKPSPGTGSTISAPSTATATATTGTDTTATDGPTDGAPSPPTGPTATPEPTGPTG